MAQYKVPQDVEADDKLIGPFSFRQFVYLLVAGGLVALAVGLFQLFPLLAIIPVPFAFFFLALALPLKKDQPMETYLAAIVSYHLKPRTKFWMPGQKESPILITAPKIVEDVRTRDITGEEATHRLSFLADIVDTGGYAIKGAGSSPMREDLVAEANATPDMFETYQSQVINRVIDQDKMSRHQTAVDEMKQAIARNNGTYAVPETSGAITGERVIRRAETAPSPTMAQGPVLAPAQGPVLAPATPVISTTHEAAPLMQQPEVPSVVPNAMLNVDKEIANSSVVVMPGAPVETKPAQKTPPKPINNSIIELANNSDFSVATIAKEANRINRKEKGEVFISLH